MAAVLRQEPAFVAVPVVGNIAVVEFVAGDSSLRRWTALRIDSARFAAATAGSADVATLVDKRRRGTAPGAAVAASVVLAVASSSAVDGSGRASGEVWAGPAAGLASEAASCTPSAGQDAPAAQNTPQGAGNAAGVHTPASDHPGTPSEVHSFRSHD